MPLYALAEHFSWVVAASPPGDVASLRIDDPILADAFLQVEIALDLIVQDRVTRRHDLDGEQEVMQLVGIGWPLSLGEPYDEDVRLHAIARAIAAANVGWRDHRLANASTFQVLTKPSV